MKERDGITETGRIIYWWRVCKLYQTKNEEDESPGKTR